MLKTNLKFATKKTAYTDEYLHATIESKAAQRLNCSDTDDNDLRTHTPLCSCVSHNQISIYEPN